MTHAEITITNAPTEVRQVSTIVDDLAAACHLSRDAVADMQVALDEVLTNIIRYGYADNRVHEIHVRLTWDAHTLTAEVEDDAAPFNPLTAPPPDLRAALSDRPVGGLGIHFVRRLMDSVEYASVDNRNRLVLRKQAACRAKGATDAGA